MTVHHMAEVDANGVCLRVIVAPTVDWPAATFGGTWREVPNPATAGAAYPGPGWRWDATLGRWFPWPADLDTGSLWCVTADWLAAPQDDRDAFLDVTGLWVTEDNHTGVLHTVFGGRPITDEDQVALAEVLG